MAALAADTVGPLLRGRETRAAALDALRPSIRLNTAPDTLRECLAPLF
jgi:hypothetical protein